MMDVGSLNALISHNGLRKALRGFALPVYAKMGLSCLWISVSFLIFPLTRQKGYAAEFIVFFRPLFLMGGYVLCVLFGLMLITFMADVLLNRRFSEERLKRQHRKSGNALLRLFTLLLPMGLLCFYMANLTHPEQSAGFSRLSVTVFLIYFGVGVCFAAANGIANLRQMFAAER